MLLATGTHTLQVPINNMASGLYLVQVMFDGKSMVRRLLVN
ncbi:MAG: T9SS type A sorting domain-containing protein [Bacteroidia bacterium]